MQGSATSGGGKFQRLCIFLLATCLVPAFRSIAIGIDDRAAAETHASLGLQFAQRGDLVHAEHELRQAAKLAPANPEILTSLGTVLSMQKKLEEASGVFKQALRVSPQDIVARRYLAANLWQMQRFPEAKQNLEILLKQKPGDPEARLLLGMVAENMKDYATAARMLSSVHEQGRQQPEAMAALARSYYHLNEQQKARDALAELSRAGAPAALLGSQIADEMRDYETAEKLLLSIPSASPEAQALGMRLATVQYHAGRFADCQRTLLGLVESGHGDGKLYSLLGWSYYKSSHPKEAVEALTHAIDLAPEDETNYRDLAGILVAERLLPSALVLARKATAAFPSSARAFELQGSVENKMGQFADATRSYSRAVELDSSRPNGFLGLAEAQFSAGEQREAVASLQGAIKRFPMEARLKVLYASVLLKQGDTGDLQANRRAEEMLRSALALDPQLPGAHYQLGKLALDAGRLPEAIDHLERAAKLDPQSGSTHFALSRAYRRAGQKDKAAQEMELYEKLKQQQEPMDAPTENPAAQSRY